MHRALRIAALLGLVTLTACSSSHRAQRVDRAHDLVGPPRLVASSGTTSTTSAVVSPASSAPAGSGTTTGGGRSSSPGTTAARSSAGRSSAARSRTSGRTALPADTDACSLLTSGIAAAVLAPQRSARSTDVDSVCAYTAGDGRTLIDIGDVALTRGQTAAGVLAQETAGQGRSGYRVSRIAVGGRWAGVLEDGRPNVVMIVWVQRGRVLTLTVSPASSSAASRLQQAASSVGVRFG